MENDLINKKEFDEWRDFVTEISQEPHPYACALWGFSKAQAEIDRLNRVVEQATSSMVLVYGRPAIVLNGGKHYTWLNAPDLADFLRQRQEARDGRGSNAD